MQLKEITKYLEQLAPLSSQESYDNSGLIVGDPEMEISAVLVSLDCTEAILDEAISLGANLIIAHHPIVFKGLKRLNGANYVERTVIKAIKNDTAIYAIHTNLDNYRFGVNHEIGRRLGLHDLKVLQPAKDTLSKLVVYVPHDQVEHVRNVMFESGSGNIGDYSDCSFELEGDGSFRPGDNTNPAVGEIGKREIVKETRIEVLVSNHSIGQVVQGMIKAHPYEEVAYDVIPIKNLNQYEGAGMIGELLEPMDESNFLHQLKEKFGCGVIRHTDLLGKPIRKVAFCGGSGSFLLTNAMRQKADIFITGDFKYHEFFDAEEKIVIADIGHYESEQFTIDLIGELLKKKFATFAVHLTAINTNPINYL
jgi:dinuclear metal center YbgI/SA1388 family protein